MQNHSRRRCLAWIGAGLCSSVTFAHTPDSSNIGLGRIVLRVYAPPSSDQIQQTVNFDLAAIKALPQVSFSSHTPWFKKPVTFTGPLLRDVLNAAQIQSGRVLKAIALDDYSVNIPWSDTTTFDMIVAHSINDVPLTARTKGPLFVVYPFDSNLELQSVQYYERAIWQLKSLKVL